MTLPRWDSVAALYALTNSMMLTPCWPRAGPTGGAGVAAPAWICSLMKPETFFFLGGIAGVLFLWCGPTPWAMTRLQRPRTDVVRSDLGDLVERQLDRGLPAEDRDQHLELLRLGVDLGDRGRQGLERTLHDGDGLADLEVDDLDVGGLLGAGLAGGGRLFLGLEVGGEHGEDLVEAQRHRLVGVADEAGDTRGVAHGAPALVGEVHADQDVAGHPDATDQLALAVLDLGDLLHGDLHLEDVGLHVEAGHARLEVGLHAVLVARVGVDDVPVTLLAAQGVLELLDRVGGLGRLSGLGRLGRLGGRGSLGGLNSLGGLGDDVAGLRRSRLLDGGLDDVDVSTALARRLGAPLVGHAGDLLP